MMTRGRAHGASGFPPAGRPALLSYDRAVITTGPASARVDAGSGVVLERLAELDDARPIDIAERFRDLPGLAFLESARPGRHGRWTYLTADPLEVLEIASAKGRPPIDDGEPGEPGKRGDRSAPFAPARALVRRMDGARITGTVDGTVRGMDAPPFLGGLVGYIGYDFGRRLEQIQSLAIADQPLPDLHLSLHDWVIAWDRRTGRAYLGGRAVDGDIARLAERLAAARARAGARALDRSTDSAGSSPPGPGTTEWVSSLPAPDLVFTSGLDRAAFEAGVEQVRDAIAHGEIYQANLTRRLEAPFGGDPWPLFRCLRTGDPSLMAAYLDLGQADGAGSAAAGRALLSASPEPFLSVDADGHVSTDPIKGTRPRGATRAEDRALARELLASGKDQAENVMIVDVLRNDLGRVCIPGSVRVPRLCRLERTAAVQHLVTTVTGRLAPDRDAFDLLAASFPGGSITGAPKIRAMEIIEELEPVRRGPYTGAAGWIGPDGAMATSILIRTLIADGRRLTIHVGGGITWRSDPGAEWDETVAKVRGPLGAIGGRETS